MPLWSVPSCLCSAGEMTVRTTLHLAGPLMISDLLLLLLLGGYGVLIHLSLAIGCAVCFYTVEVQSLSR